MVNIKQEPAMDDRMEINILDYRLKVMTIKRSAISKFTHALLDVIFLKHYLDNNKVHDCHGFVSVTETDHDYSVIVEEEAYKTFDTNDDDIKVNEGVWLPLVASAGPTPDNAFAAGISKIANSVVIPLADQGISVYCLSTYGTDFVLIQEKDFNAACEVLAQNFRITREGLLFSSEIIVDTSKINKRPAIAKGTRPLTHSFQCTNKSQYCITSMDSESLSSQALIIIDLLFYSRRTEPIPEKERFFSLSIIDHSISLVLEASLLDRFPPQLMFDNSEYWQLIRIGDMPEGMGFREAGIVAQISEPIASAHISEYYISSFYYGHVLVPVEHYDRVKKLLEEKQKSNKKLQGGTSSLSTSLSTSLSVTEEVL